MDKNMNRIANFMYTLCHYAGEALRVNQNECCGTLGL
jgi:hypothetical protein